MDQAKQYRREAGVLRREAAKIQDQELRRQLLEVAVSYEKLAEIVERYQENQAARRLPPRCDS